MRKQIFPAILAVALLATTACSPDRERNAGGGGGQTAQQDQSNRGAGVQNTRRDQLSANMSNDLSTEARDFAEAYTRAPWVHANLAAGDWERALDDLQFIDDQLNDLNRDNDVSANIKNKIKVLKPQIATLTQQIQKHDKASVQGATKLVNQFAAVTNDPLILAWMGDKTRGGGAGRGDNRMKDKH